MNDVEIVEWWHYKMQNKSIFSEFTENLYLIKLIKIEIKKWFFKTEYVDWLTYSMFKDWSYESIMTLDDFKKDVLYKVN